MTLILPNTLESIKKNTLQLPRCCASRVIQTTSKINFNHFLRWKKMAPYHCQCISCSCFKKKNENHTPPTSRSWWWKPTWIKPPDFQGNFLPIEKYQKNASHWSHGTSQPTSPHNSPISKMPELQNHNGNLREHTAMTVDDTPFRHDVSKNPQFFTTAHVNSCELEKTQAFLVMVVMIQDARNIYIYRLKLLTLYMHDATWKMNIL